MLGWLRRVVVLMRWPVVVPVSVQSWSFCVAWRLMCAAISAAPVAVCPSQGGCP